MRTMVYNGLCIHYLRHPLSPLPFSVNGPGPLSTFVPPFTFPCTCRASPKLFFGGHFSFDKLQYNPPFTVQSLLTSMLTNSILLALLPSLAVAANDWSKPCTSGTCSYESGDGINTAWSNLVIVRSPCGTLISVPHNPLECRFYRLSE